MDVKTFNFALMKSEHEQCLVYGFVSGEIEKKIKQMSTLVSSSGKARVMSLQVSSTDEGMDPYKIVEQVDFAVPAPRAAAASMGGSSARRTSMGGVVQEENQWGGLVQKEKGRVNYVVNLLFFLRRLDKTHQ